MRLQKTATGTTGVTKYSLHGQNIVHLTNTKNNLYFFYDARNKPAVVTFNGTAYAYLYNLQGDVIALIDSNGKKVVEYKYDAWGRILSKTGTMASTLGTLNPFRYRGYVYDEETGLYYLRSRYYNPEWARFLNADSHLGFRGELLAHNVYTYCVNAPVGLLDEDGLAWTMGVYEPYYGFYHREVQRWIADHNNGVVMEVSTSTGRIDLYNVRSTEIYEVKPNRSYHIEMGKRQLDRYMQGNLSTRMGDACQLILPSDGTLSYEYKNVIVDISVRAEGSLVLYSARQTYKRKKQTVSVHAAVPAREKERNEQFALQPAWGTVLGVAMLLIGAVTPWPGDEVMGWTLILAQ